MVAFHLDILKQIRLFFLSSNDTLHNECSKLHISKFVLKSFAAEASFWLPANNTSSNLRYFKKALPLGGSSFCIYGNIKSIPSSSSIYSQAEQMLIADSSITTHFKQRHQLDLSITYSISENFNLRNHVRKRKKHPIGIGSSTDGFNTCCFLSASKPVSTADGDGVLTSSFSVSFLTTNTNVSTSTTAPTTSQVATENSLSMMAKSVASLVDTLTRFVEGQKRASSGISIRQSHQSRSRYRNHYSYYRRSYS